MNTIGRTLRASGILFITLASFVLHAADVSESEILIAARKWIADNTVFQVESPNAEPVKAAQMMNDDGQPMPLWRVDLQPTGYLVMSSDDTLPPVVTFNTNGSFNMPAGHPLPAMLNRQGEIFQEELSKPLTRGNKFATENQARWNALLNRTRANSVTPSTIVRSPMLTTTWNQDAPYNYFCPSGSSYPEHSITGCVALALAQMLKYHEWPVAGSGTKTHTDNEGEIKGSLKADFSVPYDWGVMAATYEEKDYRDYTAAELAVARLAMEASVLVEADYELDATSAGSWNLHTLMAQYLGYSSSAQYGDTRSGMIGYIAQSTLYSRIRSDMTAGRPAFVSFDGHMFIADGLGTMGGQDYYHFNYGWGGYLDGWYLLTDGEENTVIIAATTNIQPSPVAVFKPMSCEQSSSFTLAWDFPKRLAAEAFRLTKTTGTRASEVISSTISGTARNYTLTGQSGTATYMLEAKVNGTWQAVSNGITVTVKTSPADMLTLSVEDSLKSIAGKQATMTISANNKLSGLTVTSSRPDILPASGIVVSGSGNSRTVKLTPVGNTFGNVLLYITATDAAGNTVRKTVSLAVMVDEPLNWHTSKTEAMAAATANGKYVLMVAGRNTCPNTNYFRNTVCETSDIKATILANYELWYVIVDSSSEYYTYSSGLGNTLPFIAIIDPADQSKRLRGHGGYMSIPDARVFLNPNTPYFSLDDNTKYVNGITKSLELSVLRSGVVIYYRLDATAPTASDTLYASAISLSATTTISARAFLNGEPVSDTVTKTYNFMDQVAKPTLSTAAKDYFFGSRLVTASCTTSGAVIRYTTNLYYPTESDPVFPPEGLEITEDTVLLIRAFKDGMLQSDWVVSELYSLNECADSQNIVIAGDVIMCTTETPWFLQTATYNSSPSAMQSGAIGNSESTSLVAKVTGSGTLAFYWKVSSESGYDKLTFSIDGVVQNNISGVTNWARKTYTVTGSGEHYLAWTYSKDYTDSANSDCGWVDDITWTPTIEFITINGSSSIATGAISAYNCTATWSDGSNTTVTPTWSLSNTTYASVSADGKVTNKNTTDTDQTVTLTASYTSNDETKTATKVITLSKRTLTNIVINGDATIASGAVVNYICMATWSYGEPTAITATWSLSSSTYASVDANGKVTNKNVTNENQTVTLSASYTVGDVTKTTTKVITLSKRILTDIAINGDAMIVTGGVSSYTCTATWSYGDSMTVTPAWSLSSNTYASIDANGKVTNKNTTDTDQTVTLNASYTVGGVTKTATKVITLAKRTLENIAINGNAAIESGDAATYTCTATWSYGNSTTVSPTWSLSSTSYASVDASGKVMNKNTTGTDQTITLNASYTINNVTKTAAKVITLAKRTLETIAINGDGRIASGETATYTCTASWSYGDPTAVTPVWSLSSTTYASIDVNGKVTNKNVTDDDQTVTVTASWTVGDVTKTATKVITLSKRTLTDIAINGDATIVTGGVSSYTCTTTWSYGDSMTVTPAWSLSSNTYASVDANGKVTNKNTTDTDQTVTLNASYTINNVTKTATKVITLAKRTLETIAINGDSTIATGGVATYACTATWSYGDSTTITPTWSLSNTNYASVDATGKVTNKNTTDTDQTVTLNASYTVGDVTKTATKDVTLAKRTLEAIAINGDSTIVTGGIANYTCMASWSYGDTAAITPIWSLSSTTYASIDTNGKVTNKNTTDTDQTVTLNASYTINNATKTATKVITLSKRTLETIVINGDSTIDSNEIASYTCTASWSYGDPATVTPVWSLSYTTYASIDVNGNVTNKNVTNENQTVTVTASLTVEGVTKTASKAITLAKRTLESIAIDGDTIIPTAGEATYTCTATWSYGDATAITPTWSLSNTNYASVDAVGKVTNKNVTNDNQTVTLKASYTVGDVTKTAIKVITLSKRTLMDIAIDGDATIASGEVASYTCTASWTYGDSMTVTPAWSLSSNTYASVDINGKVTNKNTTDTDQTVALNASYTVGDVTKTATKIITLSKRVLTNIVINGNATIGSGDNATYTCTATWSYGDSTTVSPTWSLSNTTFASVDTNGKVTNKNTTDADQSVTLTASYTIGDVTKTATKVITLSKRTLTDITIAGDEIIPSGTAATYSCTATWSDGQTSVVTATWRLSSTTYASVDTTGKVANQNTTTTDKTVTLTASYKFGGETKEATKTITLTNRSLVSISIAGEDVIPSGNVSVYVCTATWSDGATSTATAAWSLAPDTYASVDASGKVTNRNTTETDQTLTLNASYTAGDITKTAKKVITLSKLTLIDIAIAGNATIASGEVENYVCKATWSYGDSTDISPTWSLSATAYASVDAAGKVINKNTTDVDQTVTLSASYTTNNVTKTATKVITLSKRTLNDIAIIGNATIASGGAANYTCTATWSYGDPTAVTPVWTLSSTTYASIDANGMITNKNMSNDDQTVTLTASHTVGDVTKTATKVITLSKRTLSAVAINGDATIASGEDASYTCKATWSYGDPTAVTPVWTLSSTTYASIDANGKMMNKNTTDTDQTVTLTASYTIGDVTKTTSKLIKLSKRTLTDIAINGDATIASGEDASYTCTATWTYGDSTTVTPTWSLSNTNYASVDATGKVTNKNTSDEDQIVTLTASYTVGDVAKTATKSITLSKRTLTAIAIDGDATIASGETATYACSATWSYGESTAVMPIWSLSSTTYASVDNNGKVTNQNKTDEDQTVMLNASYEAGNVTKAVSIVITLAKRTLESIAIEGDTIIPTGGVSTYVCKATWSYGDSTVATPTWSLSTTTYAAVDATGRVTNKNTTDEDQTVLLTASNTVGDITQTVTKEIKLAKRTLTVVSINGDAAIASGRDAIFTCTATWSYGEPTAVTPTWSLSNTTYAIIDANGKVSNKNTTDADQSVTLTASYTVGDMTQTATKEIKLAKRTLTELSIAGDDIIPSGSSAIYSCTATWSDGEKNNVTPTWSLSATTYATVDATGKVTNRNTTNDDQTLTLTASYTFGGEAKTVSKTITLTNRSLVSVSIEGDNTIMSGGESTYVCTATWSDGATSTATAAWSLSSTTYATVDGAGKVTNQNTTATDQTVTLTASYTTGNVTKTATKVITLSKLTLIDIAIAGNSTIASGKVESYGCKATWSYGDSSDVLPTWGLSNTAYASVDVDGKVTNKNTTDKDQTVTLTASYTLGDVTKTATKVITLSKRILTDIAINGDATIATGKAVTYTCTATWSYGDPTVATPTWSLSNTTYASVDSNGKVTNKNTTDTDQTVTLTASYTLGDVTKTATKVITLSKRTLTDIAINGDTTIATGGVSNYTCTATWSYGDPTSITPTWSLSNTAYASVDTNGKVSNKNTTDTDQTATLTASHTVNGITKTATKVITLSKRTLTSITITGENIISAGEAVTYTCTATWSYGDSTAVMPTWSLSSTDYATVDADGKVSNMNMTNIDQTVTLTASYTVGDVTKTATKDITLKKESHLILELNPGWNLVTLARQLSSSADGVQKFLSLKPFMLDVENHSYVMCGHEAAVQAGNGYWVFSRKRQSIKLAQDTDQTVSQPKLKPGWNLVGLLEESTWPSLDVEIWTWSQGRFMPVEKNDLRVGCVYLVLLY